MSERRELSTYALLPAVHRLRDEHQGNPLEALLGVIDEQAQHVIANTRQMYEDWFIETCRPEMVPYIGELVGGSVSENLLPVDRNSKSNDRAMQLIFPRREVASAISLQKRKGTLSVLEEIAMSVAGWHAHTIEWYPRVAQFQDFRRLNQAKQDGNVTLQNELQAMGNTVDFRMLRQHGGLDSPFEQAAFLPDFKAARTGFYPKNRKLLRLHLWRLLPHRITQALPSCIWSCDCGKSKGPRLRVFTLDSSGLSRALCIKPEPEKSATEISKQNNLPMPLTIEELQDTSNSASPLTPKSIYYGRGKSLELWVEMWEDNVRKRTFVPDQQVVVCDLSSFICGCKSKQPDSKACTCESIQGLKSLKDLSPSSADKFVALDPEHGLAAICDSDGSGHRLLATYHTLFSAEMGGGEYLRTRVSQFSPKAMRIRVRREAACDKSSRSKANLFELLEHTKLFKLMCNESGKYKLLRPGHSIIELADSDTYRLPKCEIQIPAGSHLEIVAGKRCFPAIKLEGSTCRQAITFHLGKGAKVGFDGIKLVNGEVAFSDSIDKDGNVDVDGTSGRSSRCQPCNEEVRDPTCRITFRHCTLVPTSGSSTSKCGNTCPMLLRNTLTDSITTIDHSITGKIRQPHGRLLVVDSIVDGQGDDCSCTEEVAIEGDNVNLRTERSTILGKTKVYAIDLAADCIFHREVEVERRQVGGMRFSYVPPNNGMSPSPAKPTWNTPQQFYCQPNQIYERLNLAQNTCDSVEASDTSWSLIRSAFTSERYGDAGYCQLKYMTSSMRQATCCCTTATESDPNVACDKAITQGAESGSEMGAFHDLYQPQRQDNLRRRIEEFTPFPMHAELRIES